MSSPPPGGARHALVRRLAAAHRNRPGGEVVEGYHNSNYIVSIDLSLSLLLDLTPFRRWVKFRTPRDAVKVVPRIWPNEAEVLEVVTRYVRGVPRCLADFGDWSMHTYLAGHPLSELIPDGPVGEQLMASFAEFFARKAAVPEQELPPRPEGWPSSGDSEGFLRWLIDFTEQRVHQPNRIRFGALFRDVHIPADAMSRFRRNHPPLASRPFSLLHTDVHRGNVVVNRKRMAVIDWELAMYGDPLHDLATHLVRMDYEKDEQSRMSQLWADAMYQAGHADMAHGLDTDLLTYVDFEYAQSVFPDVMRAALSLPQDPDADDFEAAGRRVCRALRRAAEPLKLMQVPDRRHAVGALRAWHAGDLATGMPRTEDY